jgi:hypothetical protein
MKQPYRCEPVILATPEVEIRKMFVVWKQPEQIVRKTLSWKYPTQKRAGGVAQVVERLTSKHETQIQIPVPPKQIMWNNSLTMSII